MQTKTQVIQDAEGSVSLAWLTPTVLYARFARVLSADVGNALAATLHAQCLTVPSLSLFADASSLSQYDLLARSAFVRVVLANRRKFNSLVVLSWQIGVSPAMQALLNVLGPPSEALTDSNEFSLRLLRVAPTAPQILACLRTLASDQRRATSIR
jgi:hypothetical protein